ncbi:hypothetical protein sphantq_04559 (plasmid) [Sphingobium sp. AntQ-1]|uniref:DUF6691 family protein n=1 Tax=Sphingobium sp. AntQ-1 TaxID=2930091 RepID=UPI00234E4DF5|nr:DUF6691 family protein [Sphingobium sp. AntQ-1]WCP16063.1 hypothetical protein sphantq_04559 [Sphingobium sp. AntQ-1]
MNRQVIIALGCGVLFGMGLTVSGMTDPARVRAFLDVFGSWDPTLAFVMVGAMMPMAVAWRIAKPRRAPLAADEFHLPATHPIDAKLLLGATLFGVGWGLVGLCPGPAIAALALRPGPAVLFVLAMFAGATIHRFLFSRPSAGTAAT